MAERADDRLVRLLGLVAFLDGHGPVPVAELAARFGVSEKQIRDDVDQLWVTGTPGYWPDDLIDFDADAVERGVVHLTESRGLTRPLRLGTREAVALVAALRALAESPPVQADPERTTLVRSALDKLTTATGEAASAVDVRIAHDGDPQVFQAVTTALAARRALRLRYVTASDVVGERDVDPARLLTQDGAAYLLAWCRRAHGRRTFRLDRVLAATVLDEPADAEKVALVESDVDVDVGLLAASAAGSEAATVTVTLASPARWLAEQLTTEAVTELADGAFAMRLRVSNPAWLRGVLLAAAPYVLDVDPAEVAADVAASARAALAGYDEPVAPAS
ncbi:transcriptional regulator protein-like protein [Xylanimonas cellulosilytica DSM 15894]|uniref:Transcriptional regulator protein-like protein n=1 Tax=Xylanimonas cellulosilytica (strain DSM 15894 / JCM 12276 / CECT 5975 / KCTC 9989 / LMG 20990 / NBRC 107835 / XIL07) TaxID=446471 RepID=D1BSW0_XYLCX|nr:WYL domain-containing protein [Xylanimonas cellulosilytica]ACZ30802.1 transcriptional regulator protein-like protein [Xylanimonas cellulosilytica DSM 15894]